jgi:signal transduction histidine kinase
VLIPIGLYERYPLNSRITVCGILVSGFVRGYAATARTAHFVEYLPELLGIPLALMAVGLAVSLMSSYREQLISPQIGFNRLDRSIGQLTRVNQEYQDSLLRVETESAERERNRIVRDMHDVVGYTLTNNIMLMEAAADMARLNPLGVSRLLNTARGNAQEGLQRIRQILYTLRSHHSSPLHGISAVAKLIDTFRTATGIRVTTSFGNVPIQLPAGMDSTVYHLVQESMVNSFRHGQASRIDVMLSVNDDVLEILVTDDGAGAEQVTTGIGLNGMRERVTRLGGTISWEGGNCGFRIRATIPWEKTIDG